jgi:Bifunctional DNA primase/polymerase, N-terminal/Primase C terminal 1 (PriCT-1)
MMADAALDYARRGLSVFPLWSAIPFRNVFVCSCMRGSRCDNPAKHPMARLAPNGLKDATADLDRVRHLWDCAPTANIGIACSSDCIVLDVDPRHDGDNALAELQKRHGGFPTTWQAMTGGGGAHYYFRCDAEIRNSAGKIGQGIDIRGLGGYVVAPPSRHVSGRSYAWDRGRGPTDVALAAMPAWLAEAAQSSRAGKGATPASSWRDLVRNGVGEGQRNDAITRLSGHLLRRNIDPVVTLELILTWNAVRCNPPVAESEVIAIVDRIAACEFKRRNGAVHGR